MIRNLFINSDVLQLVPSTLLCVIDRMFLPRQENYRWSQMTFFSFERSQQKCHSYLLQRKILVPKVYTRHISQRLMFRRFNKHLKGNKQRKNLSSYRKVTNLCSMALIHNLFQLCHKRCIISLVSGQTFLCTFNSFACFPFNFLHEHDKIHLNTLKNLRQSSITILFITMLSHDQ